MGKATSFDEPRLAKRRLPPRSLVPILAAGAFVVLYAWAAVLYPGGTHEDPTRTTYSFVHNYWCDLLDAETKAGRSNPGRPAAIAAMVVLCGGLSVLWWNVPRLFPTARGRALWVRSAGIASGLIAPWVGTRAHDAVIRAAGLFGVVGFVATMTARGAHRARRLEIVSWTAIAFALANYAMWETRIGLAWMALVQKGAFAFFLLWIVLVSLRLREQTTTRGGSSRS
jgi:hypothetical protein